MKKFIAALFLLLFIFLSLSDVNFFHQGIFLHTSVTNPADNISPHDVFTDCTWDNDDILLECDRSKTERLIYSFFTFSLISDSQGFSARVWQPPKNFR